MKPPTNRDSLKYFSAMIAQMASTLKEYGIVDAAESLEKAQSQIEIRLAEDPHRPH